MYKTVRNIWQAAGWKGNTQFWVDAILLGLCFPFFLFPSREPSLTAALLIAWAIRWLYDAFWNLQPLNSPFSLLVVLLVGWSMIGMLVTADPDLTLDKALGILLGVAVWRTIVLHFKNKSSLVILLAAFITLGTAFVAIGFLAVDWLDKIPAISAIVSLFPQQIISFSAIGSGNGVQPNQLAGTILWVFPVSMLSGIALWQGEKRPLSLSVLFLSLILIGILVLSQSRGGWLGGLSALGMGLWLATFGLPASHWAKPGRFLLPISICVAGGIFAMIAGPSEVVNLWIDPPDASLVGDLGTLSFRQEVWTWSIQAIQDFSFTGTGLGTFRRVAHRLYPIAIPITYDIAHAHNIFLQVALDVGIPGLIFYLGLIGLFFYNGIQMLVNNPQAKTVVIGLLMAQIGFHFYGLVDAVALGAKPAVLFWMLLGLMHVVSVIEWDDEPSS